MTDSIAVVNISKYHGRTPVFENVTRSWVGGEFIALVGKSGSGKSSLLNILGLLDTPDHGEVRFNDVPAPAPGSVGARRLLRRKIGYLFQNFALIDDATVAYNMGIAAKYSPRGLTPTHEALEMVGLVGMGHRPVFTLSGGEQQRLAIARLLVRPCDIILADEPTGSLDRSNGDVVLRFMREWAQQGKCVICATHDPSVAAVADSVVEFPLS